MPPSEPLGPARLRRPETDELINQTERLSHLRTIASMRICNYAQFVLAAMISSDIEEGSIRWYSYRTRYQHKQQL